MSDKTITAIAERFSDASEEIAHSRKRIHDAGREILDILIRRNIMVYESKIIIQLLEKAINDQVAQTYITQTTLPELQT